MEPTYTIEGLHRLLEEYKTLLNIKANHWKLRSRFEFIREYAKNLPVEKPKSAKKSK